MDVSLQKIMERANCGLYGQESYTIAKMAGILIAAKFDRDWGPFICGTSGHIVPNTGLHEGYLICPSYGADWTLTTIYNMAFPDGAPLIKDKKLGDRR